MDYQISKLLKNNKGFGAIEGILIALGLLLVTGVGYYVYSQQNNDKQESANTQNTIQPQTTTDDQTDSSQDSAPEDKAENWTSYTSKKGKFSLKYPPKWVQPTDKELCNPGLFDRTLYLGPTKDDVLTCGSSNFGQIAVYSVDGDKRSNYELSSSQYKNINTSSVKVDGVSGTKVTGVAKDNDDPFAPREGTYEVKYTFYTNGITYGARNTQGPNSPDVRNDFDYMITKTLSFN